MYFKQNEFEKNHIKNIYLDELELKKENEDTCVTSFLDLSIEVRDWKFTNELLDKRDVFLFFINGMPRLDSNMTY